MVFQSVPDTEPMKVCRHQEFLLYYLQISNLDYYYFDRHVHVFFCPLLVGCRMISIFSTSFQLQHPNNLKSNDQIIPILGFNGHISGLSQAC